MSNETTRLDLPAEGATMRARRMGASDPPSRYPPPAGMKQETTITAQRDAEGRLLPIKLPHKGSFVIVIASTYVELVDPRGEPITDLDCRFKLPNGTAATCTLDANGKAQLRADVLLNGRCELSLVPRPSASSSSGD